MSLWNCFLREISERICSRQVVFPRDYASRKHFFSCSQGSRQSFFPRVSESRNEILREVGICNHFLREISRDFFGFSERLGGISRDFSRESRALGGFSETIILENNFGKILGFMTTSFWFFSLYSISIFFFTEYCGICLLWNLLNKLLNISKNNIFLHCI